MSGMMILLLVIDIQKQISIVMNIQKNMFSGEIITEIIAIKIKDKTAIKAGTYKFKAADNKLNRG